MEKKSKNAHRFVFEKDNIVEFDWLTYEETLKVVDEMKEEIMYRDLCEIVIKKISIHPIIMTYLQLHIDQYRLNIRTGLRTYTYFNHIVTVDSGVPGYLIE